MEQRSMSAEVYQMPLMRAVPWIIGWQPARRIRVYQLLMQGF
jgi:hypothetical protein